MSNEKAGLRAPFQGEGHKVCTRAPCKGYAVLWCPACGVGLCEKHCGETFGINCPHGRVFASLDRVRLTPIMAIGFLRSCVRSGESLSAEDDRDIDDAIAGLNNASEIRAALIRLLWREVADGGGCVCEDGEPQPTDTCMAMRALGWGQHWDPEGFQRHALDMGGNAQ